MDIRGYTLQYNSNLIDLIYNLILYKLINLISKYQLERLSDFINIKSIYLLKSTERAVEHITLVLCLLSIIN